MGARPEAVERAKALAKYAITEYTMIADMSDPSKGSVLERNIALALEAVLRERDRVSAACLKTSERLRRQRDAAWNDAVEAAHAKVTAMVKHYDDLAQETRGDTRTYYESQAAPLANVGAEIRALKRNGGEA